jgi:hypothetical protein
MFQKGATGARRVSDAQLCSMARNPSVARARVREVCSIARLRVGWSAMGTLTRKRPQFDSCR